jgi:hypothetical protein
VPPSNSPENGRFSWDFPLDAGGDWALFRARC